MTGPGQLRHHLTTCRSCSASVFWGMPEPGSKSTSLMIISAEPSPDGNILMTERPAGAPHYMRVLRREEIPDHPVLYRSHFADCPDSPKWRRR